MRTILDGKTDIRPYDSGDVSSTPLPYVQSYIFVGTSASDRAIATNTFTDADWGTDLDFYLLAIRLSRNNALIMGDNDGLLFKISIQETGEILFLKTFQENENQNLVSNLIQYNKRLRIPRRVLSTQTIEVIIENHTDSAISGANNTIVIYLFGSAV